MPIHLGRSGRVLLALLVALTFIHWDCSSLFNPAPSLISVKQDADPVQYDQNTGTVPNQVLGCNPIPYNNTTNKTLPTTWDFVYSNNTENHVPILWPKGGIGASPNPILLWDDPANMTTPFNAIQTAAQSWQNALTTFATGQLLVSLQISANSADENNANIQVYDSTQRSLDNPDGSIGGTNVYTDINNWSTLVQSRIVLEAYNDQNTEFDYALHEIGHALGLRHSIYQESVMFPTGSPCMAYGSFGFDYADLAWLESTYDPRWVTPKPVSSPSTCRRPPCPLLRRSPQTIVLKGRLTLSHPYIVRRGQRSGPPFPPYHALIASLQRASGIPNHPRAHWMMADDPTNASTLSSDSVWLAASLVAQVRVLRQVGRIVHDPIATVYETARVERIFKNAYGPDSSVKPGDTILIADNQMKEGDEFLDDQTLSPRDGPALVFLTNVGGRYPVGGVSMPIHGFTAPFDSKYALRSGSVLVPLSIRNTVLHQDYATHTLASVLQQAATGRPAAPLLPMASATRLTAQTITAGLLARNGMTTPQQIGSYARQLTIDPYSYYRQRAGVDVIRNRNRIPATKPYIR